MKIPFAFLQKIAVTTLCILAVFFGCNDKDVLERMDEATFGKNLETVPVNLVSLESLPEWMQEEINAYVAESGTSGHWVTYKGEWKNQSIYFVHNNFKSCYCDFRYENGKGVVGLEYSESKNWTLIYEYFGVNAPKAKSLSVSDKREIKDKYKFPNISGMNDWSRPNIIKA